MSPPPALDIPDAASRCSRETAERPALSFYRGKALVGRLTYGELAAKVDALAGGLHAATTAFGAGDRVAILAPNRLEIPVLVLALLRLGAVVVPLNPGSAPEDWAYILAHSGARGLCATRELAGNVPEARRGRSSRCSSRTSFARRGARRRAGAGRRSASSMAVVLYTSGTTGSPKGVALRQRNLLCERVEHGAELPPRGARRSSRCCRSITRTRSASA